MDVEDGGLRGASLDNQKVEAGEFHVRAGAQHKRNVAYLPEAGGFERRDQQRGSGGETSRQRSCAEDQGIMAIPLDEDPVQGRSAEICGRFSLIQRNDLRR